VRQRYDKSKKTTEQPQSGEPFRKPQATGARVGTVGSGPVVTVYFLVMVVTMMMLLLGPLELSVERRDQSALQRPSEITAIAFVCE
jgi:hypothetical protein